MIENYKFTKKHTVFVVTVTFLKIQLKTGLNQNIVVMLQCLLPPTLPNVKNNSMG